MITGKHPGVGHFTPNGRHFIVTNLMWGDDLDVESIGATQSYLSVIRFGDSANANDEVVHQIVATALVGGSAEEFAISPDGRFIVIAEYESQLFAVG